MADLDAFTIGVIIMIVVIIVIAFLEMKYLRKSMKARRGGAPKRVAEMPGGARHALLTARRGKGGLGGAGAPPPGPRDGGGDDEGAPREGVPAELRAGAVHDRHRPGGYREGSRGR